MDWQSKDHAVRRHPKLANSTPTIHSLLKVTSVLLLLLVSLIANNSALASCGYFINYDYCGGLMNLCGYGTGVQTTSLAACKKWSNEGVSKHSLVSKIIDYRVEGTFCKTRTIYDGAEQTFTMYIFGGCSVAKKDDKNLGAPKSCTTSLMAGNPINTFSGNKYYSIADYNHAGPSQLNFTRYYNSQGDRKSSLGLLWTHTYDSKLTLDLDGKTVRHLAHDGRVLRFYLVDGVWKADADVKSTLSKISQTWIYTEPDGDIREYDAKGLLTKVIDEKRVEYLLNYADDNLMSVVDDYGNTLSFEYNEKNKIIKVLINNNEILSNAYSESGMLEYVIKSDGTRTQYHYENSAYPFFLTGITDGRGVRFSTYTYDQDGRANSSQHANGVGKVELNFNSDGTTSVKNSHDFSSTYNFEEILGGGVLKGISGIDCAACNKRDSVFEYDTASSNLLSKTANGIRTEYGNYDNKHNPGFVIEAAGTVLARKKEYTYDPRYQNKITTETEPSICPTGKKITTHIYDNFSNIISIIIDGFKADCSAAKRSTTMRYDGPLNQISEIDGPRTDISDVTKFEYYPNDPGEGDNRARLQRVIGPTGMVLRHNIQYSATGKVLSESRLNGLTITNTYYAGNDRLQSRTQSSGGINRTVYWSYLPTGEVKTITVGYGTPEALTLTLFYDDARRLTRVSDAAGNYIEYRLDSEGNKLNENYMDSAGTLYKSISQTFDTYDQLTTIMQANESRDYSYSQEGVLEKQINGEGGNYSL